MRWETLEYITKRSRTLLIVLGFVLVASMAIIDYYAKTDIFFSVIYLLPLFIIAWFLGKWAGVVISMVSAILVTFVSTIAWIMTDVIPADSSFINTIPAWNVSAKFGFFLAFVYILAALKSALTYERELARTDYLTAIGNRRFFFELSNIETKRLLRHKRPFAMAYLDIDNFKEINDQFGHKTGDEVLILISTVARRSLRSYDIIARVGGDEFTILLPETDLAQSKIVMDRLVKNFKDAVACRKWNITLSIGVIAFRCFGGTIDEMVNLVDGLMYQVKKSGKNDIRYQLIDNMAVVTVPPDKG